MFVERGLKLYGWKIAMAKIAYFCAKTVKLVSEIVENGRRSPSDEQMIELLCCIHFPTANHRFC